MPPFLRPITRRAAGKLLAALPAVAAMPSWASPSVAEDKPPSAEADFIAAQEPGLSPQERERLKKALVEQDKALTTIREFKLDMGVGPAWRFHPLRSKRP
jgi:hypothetical protein